MKKVNAVFNHAIRIVILMISLSLYACQGNTPTAINYSQQSSAFLQTSVEDDVTILFGNGVNTADDAALKNTDRIRRAVQANEQNVLIRINENIGQIRGYAPAWNTDLLDIATELQIYQSIAQKLIESGADEDTAWTYARAIATIGTGGLTTVLTLPLGFPLGPITNILSQVPIQIDLTEAQAQSFENLAEMLATYEAILDNPRSHVLLVAQSQGNFLGKLSYESLNKNEQCRFTSVSVANPLGSPLDGDLRYITFPDDTVVNAIRTFTFPVAPGSGATPLPPLPPNSEARGDIPCTNPVGEDPTRHRFDLSYFCKSLPFRNTVLDLIGQAAERSREKSRGVECADIVIDEFTLPPVTDGGPEDLFIRAFLTDSEETSENEEDGRTPLRDDQGNIIPVEIILEPVRGSLRSAQGVTGSDGILRGQTDDEGVLRATATISSVLPPDAQYMLVTATAQYEGENDLILETTAGPRRMDLIDDEDDEEDDEELGGGSVERGRGNIVGDPHIYTIDREHFSFMGSGEYLLIRSEPFISELSPRFDPGTPQPLEPFELQARFRPFAGSRVATMTSAIAFRIGEDRYSITLNPQPEIYVNDQLVQFTPGIVLSFLSSRAVLSQLGTYEFGSSTTGARVNVTPYFTDSDLFAHLSLSPFLPEDYRGGITGMLGNFDGNSNNDLVSAQGQPISTEDFNEFYRIFGDSWRINPSESLFVYRAGENTETFTDLSFPSSFPEFTEREIRQATELCEQIPRNPAIIDIQDCIFDVAVMGGGILGAYGGEGTELPLPLESMDPQLVQILRDATDFQVDDIFPSDLLEVKLLNLSGVSSLRGLETARLDNLQQLGIVSNDLTSLAGLPSQLPSLVELDIRFNPMLQSLEGLPETLGSLEALALDGSKLQTLKDLPQELPNLSILRINDNDELIDLQGLPQALPQLTELSIQGNDSLQTLEGIPQSMPLSVSISISDNASLQSLVGMPQSLPNLNGLNISFNEKLQSLVGMPQLMPNISRLSIGQTQITNLQGMSQDLPNLLRLDISNNPQLFNLDGMPPSLPRLDDLVISSNFQLQSLQGMTQSLSALTGLSLSNNALQDLVGITQNLPGLKILSIKNIGSLQGLPDRLDQLTQLSLSEKGQSELASLDPDNLIGLPMTLPSLIEFEIGSVNTFNLKSLEGMPQEMPLLTSLSINAEINTLEGMPDQLPALTSLTLKSKELENFRGMPQSLPRLTSLSISGQISQSQLATATAVPDLVGFTQDMPDLISLSINNIALESLQGLPATLPNLTNLDIVGARDLKNLIGMPQNMPALRFFRLTTSTRSGLETLQGMPQELLDLRTLFISQTRLTNLIGISSVPNLQTISISNPTLAVAAYCEVQDRLPASILAQVGAVCS